MIHLKRVKVQQLGEKTREKRLARCKRMLKRYNKNDIDRMVFSDEKDFLLDTVPVCTQNSRVYGSVQRKNEIAVNRLVVEKKHFSRKLMVWAAVSKHGKSKIHFIDPKSKVDRHVYMKVLKDAKPALDNIHGSDGYIFQQDGATSHTAKETVQFLKSKFSKFLKPNEWPPSSPDLNVMDYYVWGALQEMVYEKPVKSVAALKRRIIACWKKLSQEKINLAIDQFRERMKLIILNKGGHCETFFA